MKGTGMLRIAAIVFLGFGLSACQSAEERAEGHYESALELIAAGDPDRATVELRNVFQIDGSHLEARRLLASLMLERGNRQEAYSQYLRLAEQYPDDLDARVELSRIAFSANNWDEVERHGERAEALAPEDPRVQVLTTARSYRDLALAEDAAGRRDVARAAEALLADHPDDTILTNLLIDNHLRENNFAEALTLIEGLLETDPTNETYNQQLIAVLAQVGDMDALEVQLRRMVELLPDVDSHKATLIRYYLSRGELDKAETFLRELAAAAAEDDPGPRVDVIRYVLETQGVEAARAEIETAIAEVPDPLPFQLILAGIDFNAGQREEAVAALEEILARIEPVEAAGETDEAEASIKVDEVKVALAQMYLEMGNEVGARTRIEEVLAEFPTQASALKMQAAWNIEEDDTDAAIAALRTALDQEPEDSAAMGLMADAYIRAGSPQLARDFLALAVDASNNAPAESIRYARVLIDEERYLPAEDILLPALRLDPTNMGLLLAMGQLYMAMEDFARTDQVIDSLRRLETPEGTQAANQLEAARINGQAGTEEALAYLEGLAGQADADMASRLMLLRAQVGLGNVESARTTAEEMLAENPDDVRLQYVMAVTLTAVGDLDAAETQYRAILADDPARPQIWLDLSRLNVRRGDQAAAEAAIEEGLEHSPDNGQLLWGRASFLEQQGDIEGAIAVYETLYEENSDSVVVVNNLASLIATYRDDPESLDRAWTIAKRLRDTDLAPMQDTYGWIAHKRGDSADALPYLESAAAGLPEDPIVQYHLGMVYIALERPEDALTQMKKAVDLTGPGDERAQIKDARALVLNLPAQIEAGETAPSADGN